MELKGSLETMSLPNIIQWLADSEKTGSLIVTCGSEEKTIYFKNGRIISAASNLDKDRFGVLVVKRGYVSQDEFMKLMEEARREGKLIGKLCVEKGLFSEDDARKMLQEQTVKIIDSIFHRTEGDFRFEDSSLPDHDLVEISLVMHQLFFDTASKRNDWRHIYDVLGSMNTRLKTSNSPPASLSSLTELEKQLISKCDTRHTVLEICSQMELSDFEICMNLTRLLENKWIERIDPEAEINRELEEILWHVSILLEQKRFYPALRHMENLNRDYPNRTDIQSMLEKCRGLIEEDIEKLLGRENAVPFAKPGISTQKLQSMDIDPKGWFVFSRINGKLTLKQLYQITGFGRKKTRELIYGLISNGAVQIETMEDTDPPPKTSKTSGGGKREARQAPHLDRPLRSTESPVKTSEKPVSKPSPRKETEKRRKTKKNIFRTGEFRVPDHYLKQKSKPDENEEEILDLATLNDIYSGYLKMNHYDILGVHRTANGEEIRNAFVKLSKNFHPDMHFNELDSAVQDRLEELFSLVNHAYRVLSNTASRKRYDEQMWADSRFDRSNRVEIPRYKPLGDLKFKDPSKIKIKKPKPAKTASDQSTKKTTASMRKPAPEKPKPRKEERAEKPVESTTGSLAKWKLLLEEGHELIRNKKFREAMESLTKALKYNAREKEIYYYLSYAQTRIGGKHLPEAEENIKKALILDSENPAYYTQMARIQMAKNILPEAERYAKTALAWDDEYRQAKRILEKIKEIKNQTFLQKLLKKPAKKKKKKKK